MTQPPLIGLTSYVENAAWGVWDAPAALVPLSYVRAVENAGGRPVVLPPHGGPADATLEALDGLVLVGGADIDPASYGAKRHPETTGTRPDRDRSERSLLEGAIERDLPVLAICRGMQLLNVCRGGDLVQHLEDASVAATHKQAPGVFARHDVKVAADSRLGSILGERALVLSHHHQAPRCLGRDLEAVAWADDGTIEAIEDRSRRFLLGILWHPEEGEDRALFEALVDCARGGASTEAHAQASQGIASRGIGRR